MAGGVIKIGPFPTPADMERIKKAALLRMATEARSIIARRTADGVNSVGRPFKEYSEGYRLDKTAAQRSGKPDLTLTGQMLGALTVKRATSKLAVLGFKPERRKDARLHRSGKKQVVSDIATKKTLRKQTVKKGGDAKFTNSDLARWHHFGLGRNKARPWFEIVHPRERAQILRVGIEFANREIAAVNARNRQKVGR